MMLCGVIWVYLNGIIATFGLSPLIIIMFLVGHRGCFSEWVSRAWGRWIMQASGMKVVVEGEENLVRDRSQIIGCNQQSWYDVFALAAILPKRFCFIAKAELRKIPIFGYTWESAGHISIQRQDRSKAIQA